MRKKTGDEGRERWEDRGKEKDPEDMGLAELRAYFERRIEAMKLYSGEGYAWAIKWMSMPIEDFEKLWIEVKGKSGGILSAKGQFFIETGAMTKKGAGLAVVVPPGYSGPVLMKIIDWRFRELDLINFAKKKSVEHTSAGEE